MLLPISKKSLAQFLSLIHQFIVKPVARINKHPVMLKSSSFHLAYFGLFSSLGFVASTSVFFFYLHTRDALTGLPVLPIALLYLLGDMIGVKAFYFFALGKDFFKKPLFYLNETTMYNQGGLFGMLAVGISVALLYEINMLVMFDALALSSCIGLFFGRLGCCNYGCCFGVPTQSPVFITYEEPNSKIIRTNPELRGIALVPTQIYTAYFDLFMFVIFSVIANAFPVDGLISLIFIFLFNGFRIVIQKYRFIEPSDRLNYTRTAMLYLAAGLVIWVSVFAANGATWSIHVSSAFFTPGSWVRFLAGSTNVCLSMVLIGVVAFLFYGLHGRKLGTHLNLERE
jgi:prolipoprotein diacylglyceryltransferase